MGVIAIASEQESSETRKNTVGKPLSGVEIKLEQTGVSQLLCRLRGKEIKAYCILKENFKLTPTEIRNACFDLLPRRAIPAQVIIVSSLPLLANGKIDRQKLY